MVIYFRCVCVFLEKLVSTIVFVLKEAIGPTKVGITMSSLNFAAERKGAIYNTFLYTQTSHRFWSFWLLGRMRGRRMRM